MLHITSAQCSRKLFAMLNLVRCVHVTYPPVVEGVLQKITTDYIEQVCVCLCVLPMQVLHLCVYVRMHVAIIY